MNKINEEKKSRNPFRRLRQTRAKDAGESQNRPGEGQSDSAQSGSNQSGKSVAAKANGASGTRSGAQRSTGGAGKNSTQKSAAGTQRNNGGSRTSGSKNGAQKSVANAQKNAGGSRAAAAKNGTGKNTGGTRAGRNAASKAAAAKGGGAKTATAGKNGGGSQAAKKANNSNASGGRKKSEGAAGGQKKNAPSVKIIPLGGIGEIGKNMTAIVYEDDMIVIDAGLMFPREELLGVDYVIPDITFLRKNLDKLRGIFLTHGHEDHIGGLPYIWQDLRVPVHGSALTLALVQAKMSEHPKVVPEYVNVKSGDRISAGAMEVEYIRVSHSIDDAMALAIKTPVGVIVHTGDFKVDLTPVGGDVIDLNRFAELGKKGVLALMSDSTNAERPGMTMSESEVGDTFINYFKQAKGRIILASFASNVHRIQQVINVAKVYNRKVCLAGRSMIKVVNVTREIGYLEADDDMFVSMEDLKKLRDNQVVILTTGSQGESMSGLVRMAMGQHKQINIKEGDLVIISASPIPGNERSVSDVVNMLYRKGAEVINDADDNVHVSGHASREELKLMLTLTKPRYFIPVHGEYRHLFKHAALAEKLGIKKKNIFIPEIGSVIELNKSVGIQKETVTSGNVLIDGLGVGDVGNVVLRDRKQLSSDGMFIVIVTINAESGELLQTPDVISRGFIYMKESEDMLEKTKEIVTQIVDECCESGTVDWSTLKSLIKTAVSNYLYDMTKRSPMILPVVIEI